MIKFFSLFFLLSLSCGVKKAPTPPEQNLLPSVLSVATKEVQKNPVSNDENEEKQKNKQKNKN